MHEMVYISDQFHAIQYNLLTGKLRFVIVCGERERLFVYVTLWELFRLSRTELRLIDVYPIEGFSRFGCEIGGYHELAHPPVGVSHAAFAFEPVLQDVLLGGDCDDNLGRFLQVYAVVSFIVLLAAVVL